MIKKIDHIGIAVKNLSEQKHYYENVLGLKLIREEEIAEHGFRIVMYQVGEVIIELLHSTSENSVIAKFLEKKASVSAIHHIAYEVDDLEKELKGLKKAGVKLIDETPQEGAHGKKIAFSNPSSTFGVLTEFCQ